MRVFHGPVNIASAGPKVARWQRESGIHAVSFATNSKAITDQADRNVTFPDHPRWRHYASRAWFFLRVALRFDVFVFYYGRTLLPHGLDLPMLRALGKRIIMMYCGSEARLASVERPRNPYFELLPSVVASASSDPARRKEMAWASRWAHAAVAPRDLYDSVIQVWDPQHVVEDIWLVNAIDLRDFELRRATVNDPPLVIHAPSSPEIKGTSHVESAIQRLKRRGCNFEYRRIQGVPHKDAVSMLAEADVVIDQVLVGGFGTLSVEAMAWGKPVCAFLTDEVRSEHFPDCPIINVSVDTLEEQLAWLLNDGQARRDVGLEGRAFVEKYLDLHVVGHRFNGLIMSL